MRETIELEAGDSVAILRHRLEGVRSRRVALLVPPDSVLLRSEVQLALVRRTAEALALDLVLVTGDTAVAERARAVGLRTVGSLPAAYRLRSLRRGGPSSRLSQALRATTSLARPQAASVLRLAMPVRPGSVGTQIAVLALAVGAVLALLLGAALLLPSATVLLDPIGEVANVEADVSASAQLQQIDYEQKRVPARQVQTEVIGEETGQTTGRETMPDGHATGEVVLANKTTEEVTVPKGTVVRTNDGIPVKFYTLLDAKVPGSFGATARVPIMAFEPGSEGNVQALTIRVVEGEPSFQVDVLNDKALQGGTEKPVAIVSAEDRDRFRATLMQRLQQEAYNRLVGDLSQGEWVPPDSLDIQVVEETFDKKVGEQSEMLRLLMKVRVTGLAVAGQGTQSLLTRLLETRQAKGLVVNESTLQVQQPVGSAGVEGQVIRFKARASALMVPVIDLGALSRHIAGQDPKRATLWLTSRYALRQPPQIRLQPAWWPRLPWLPWRIHARLAGGL